MYIIKQQILEVFIDLFKCSDIMKGTKMRGVDVLWQMYNLNLTNHYKIINGGPINSDRVLQTNGGMK